MDQQYLAFIEARSKMRPTKLEDVPEKKKQDTKLTSTILDNSKASLQEIKRWREEKTTPENEFWGK